MSSEESSTTKTTFPRTRSLEEQKNRARWQWRCRLHLFIALIHDTKRTLRTRNQDRWENVQRQPPTEPGGGVVVIAWFGAFTANVSFILVSFRCLCLCSSRMQNQNSNDRGKPRNGNGNVSAVCGRANGVHETVGVVIRRRRWPKGISEEAAAAATARECQREDH